MLSNNTPLVRFHTALDSTAGQETSRRPGSTSRHLHTLWNQLQTGCQVLSAVKERQKQ